MEYLDGAVLMDRSNETLMRLLHLLQQLASPIGLLLNGSKCQLLSIPSAQLISLSFSPLPSPRCVAFYGLEPQVLSLSEPIILIRMPNISSFISSTSSSSPDVSFRCSQASRAFKCFPSVIHLYLLAVNFKSALKSSNLLCSLALVRKSTLRLRLHASTPSITKPLSNLSN